MKRGHKLVAGLAVGVVLGLLSGCGGHGGTHKGGSKGHHGDHSHGAGKHGGTLADWGGGKFHIEFVVDHDKKEATVYVLGSDARNPAPIAATDGKISARLTGLKDQESFDVELKAVPLDTDPAGRSSRFVGQHEKIGVEQEFEGTVSGDHEGTPYTGKFKEEPAKQ